MEATAPVATKDIVSFISRWQAASGTERANYQLFLTELTTLLGLPPPDPASEDTRDNSYVFERRVDIRNPDGSENRGYIDLYKRNCFVLEAKQTGKTIDTHGWDKAMLAAQHQADQYIRALPADEGRPPFIVVTDVGRSLELYAEFSRTGANYVPFPDPGHHRIRLQDLNNPDIQERLRLLWLDPLRLDPSKYAARVTREISITLAKLARSLEQDGYEVQRVARFLMRCLFTMFAEDVELLPSDGFTRLLKRLKDNPDSFVPAMENLWHNMNHGLYDAHFMQQIKRFNGGLFADTDPVPLTSDQIELLINAARSDWRFVEPAIFGTLLERALDPRERHKLGAHYTPRTYVERLVMPTIIEPLRREWSSVQVAAEAWLGQDKPNKAIKELHEFHHQLCKLRILDPACGSGNFLYVALENLKRLEGEVLNMIADLSGGQSAFEAEGLTVDPHQFLGLEVNPRAAAIAEMVLWIGYLQWHYRIYKKLQIPEPILRDFHNIECRDALIDWESIEPMLDEHGNPVTRWDGRTTKLHSVTGEVVPDEFARIVVYRYKDPIKAEWPQANFIVGNPPFIGNKRMRLTLGDGYAEALRKTYPDVPETADFVMYWWHHAADLARSGRLRHFGFITTNSLRQTFNRRIIEHHMEAIHPLSLLYAVPDHPWVDAADGAAVRIAMTVGAGGDCSGTLETVVSEKDTGGEGLEVITQKRVGKLHSDLKYGANISGTKKLQSNLGLSFMGVTLVGVGFVVEPDDVEILKESDVVKPYMNGRDLTQVSRGCYVIDFYGYSSEVARQRFPNSYQRVLERVKPLRDQGKRESRKKEWWQFGEKCPAMREALKGLSRYVGTTETAKHRIFSFLDAIVIPDQKIRVIASDSGVHLGILSSRIHILWSVVSGARQGVGNDPVYNNTLCFEPFPFPDANELQTTRIRDLAEQIDSHRKHQQEVHEGLTLTGMYNVLEKFRKDELLTAKEKTIHEQGLISVLQQLHNELDAAVFNAYGWDDLADVLVGRPGGTTPLTDKSEEQAEAEEDLLCRLVDLNHQRVAEEAQGHIRWLRPEFQAPAVSQQIAELPVENIEETIKVSEITRKRTFPKGMKDQVGVVREILAIAPQSADQIAAHFKRKPIKSVQPVLDALGVMNIAKRKNDIWYLG